MDNKSAQRCLKTFLEVSKIQIDNKDRAIKYRKGIKKFLDTPNKTAINAEMEKLSEERDEIQGKLDSVRLEVLEILVKNPFLIPEEAIVRRRCSNALELIAMEKDKIIERGLYEKYPCSINEILTVALDSSEKEEKISFSLFPVPKLTSVISEEMVVAAVNQKNVRIMIKKL